jgi:hypothetical protein
MTKLIVFPARRTLCLAARLLSCSASRASLNPPVKWVNRPVPPEPLGNMLQRLALLRPAAVLLLTNVVAEMLNQIEQESQNGH